MGEPVQTREELVLETVAPPGAAPANIDSGTKAAWQEVHDLVPSTATGALLAGAGGFLDGFTYVGHGHVFANAMTGNVVLLGVNCVAGAWNTGFRHLPPILAFLVGISVARAIQLEGMRRWVRFPYLSVLALEMGILLVLSFLPMSTPDFWITTTIAFAASVQVQTFRKVNGKSYNSTYTTGNLRTLSESAFDWLAGENRPESARVVRDFALICASFLVGAMAGGFATTRMGNRALWIDFVPLLIVVVRIWPRRRPALA
jgi:uncharacterized membrane protein YoaK (UPF0700 family)